MVYMEPDVEVLGAIEQAAWLDTYQAAEKSTVQALGLSSVLLSGNALIANKTANWSFFNRGLNFGAGKSSPSEGVPAAVSWLSRHAAKNWYLPVAPFRLNEPLRDALAANGLIGIGPSHAKLWRAAVPLDQNHVRPASIEIREVGADDAELFGSTADAAIGWPMVASHWIGRLAGRPQWRVYVAFVKGCPAGMAATFRAADVAWVTFAGTLPAFRRCGVQQTLLQRRISDGLETGVHLFVAGAVPPSSGHDATSFRNLCGAGFRPAYIDEGFSRPPPAS